MFALAFLAAAMIRLLATLTQPAFEFMVWQSALGTVTASYDGVIIAAFSLFTIALIPILWIYALGAARARWVVLVFGILKIGLWWQGFGLIPFTGWAQSALTLEPALILAALIALFHPASLRWLHHSRRAQLGQFD